MLMLSYVDNLITSHIVLINVLPFANMKHIYIYNRRGQIIARSMPNEERNPGKIGDIGFTLKNLIINNNTVNN
jgi:hypothetical protein